MKKLVAAGIFIVLLVEVMAIATLDRELVLVAVGAGVLLSACTGQDGGPVVTTVTVAASSDPRLPALPPRIPLGSPDFGVDHDAVIRYNTCVNNAPGAVNAFYDGGQIVVSASRNVQVYNNTVRGRDGIGLLQQLRTDWPDGRGAHELHTVSVHDNDISVTDLGGWHEPTGLVCDAATLKPQVWTTWGNTWAANHYHCSPTSSAVFDWSDGWRDFATWQATYAMDTPAGTIDATIPAFPAPPVPDVGPR